LFYSCHCHFLKGSCSLNAGELRRRRRRREKPVHAQSLRGSLLGQRDPQHAAEAAVSLLEGVAAERCGVGGVCETRRSERARQAAAGILCRREAPLLSGGGAQPREARQGLELRCVQRQELHQLRNGSTRWSGLV